MRQAHRLRAQPPAVGRLPAARGREGRDAVHARTPSRLERRRQPYDYDPDKAKALLAEAGAERPDAEVLCPTEVTRPYMPDPKDIFTSRSRPTWRRSASRSRRSRKLERRLPRRRQRRQHDDLHLLGLDRRLQRRLQLHRHLLRPTQGRASFADQRVPWGKTLFDDLQKADADRRRAERDAAYKELNKQIMGVPAGVPISHSPPAIVLGEDVQGLVAEPAHRRAVRHRHECTE